MRSSHLIKMSIVCPKIGIIILLYFPYVYVFINFEQKKIGTEIYVFHDFYKNVQSRAFDVSKFHFFSLKFNVEKFTSMYHTSYFFFQQLIVCCHLNQSYPIRNQHGLNNVYVFYILNIISCKFLARLFYSY